MNVHIIVMGVSGCGKTTVAQAISNQFGYEMAEGDDLHPQANIDKMSAGIPLTDDDRRPWLARIAQWIQRKDSEGIPTVVSCSALKRSYRDALRKTCPVYLVHLKGSFDVIASRMSSRKGHFMPTSLLESQFETLEDLHDDEDGYTICVDGDIEEVESEALDAVRAYAGQVQPNH